MSKIFSKFKKEVVQEVIANNTNILSQLIPYAFENYVQDKTARLVAIEVKDYDDVRRFILLYEFYENGFFSRRLIVDYHKVDKNFIIIDWSLVKHSHNYAVIKWNNVESNSEVLALYPGLFQNPENLLSVSIRLAVLTDKI